MMKHTPIFCTALVLLLCGCAGLQELRKRTDPTEYIPRSAPQATAATQPSDDARVIATLTERAEAGDALAQNNLASRYQAGDGVPKDLTKAFVLYQKAAASGLALPESNLGFMYDLGLGTPQDRKLANEWYQKAAEQGYAPAMLNIGLNIAGGKGATQDLIEGMMWIDLARFYTQFDNDMKVKWTIRAAYDHLKAMMSKEDFEEAQKRSRAWDEVFRAKRKEG